MSCPTCWPTYLGLQPTYLRFESTSSYLFLLAVLCPTCWPTTMDYSLPTSGLSIPVLPVLLDKLYCWIRPSNTHLAGIPAAIDAAINSPPPAQPSADVTTWARAALHSNQPQLDTHLCLWSQAGWSRSSRSFCFGSIVRFCATKTQ